MNFGDRGEGSLHRGEPSRRDYLRREIRRRDHGGVEEIVPESRREFGRRARDTRRPHPRLIRLRGYNLRGEMRRRDHGGVEEIETESRREIARRASDRRRPHLRLIRSTRDNLGGETTRRDHGVVAFAREKRR